ncbi:MAG: hypothetical protein HY537_04660 [Deltaproteobacteria bacterium]|nr:hypothetical protein [Deltaproteobacteria bacterium]
MVRNLSNKQRFVAYLIFLGTLTASIGGGCGGGKDKQPVPPAPTGSQTVETRLLLDELRGKDTPLSALREEERTRLFNKLVDSFTSKRLLQVEDNKYLSYNVETTYGTSAISKIAPRWEGEDSAKVDYPHDIVVGYPEDDRYARNKKSRLRVAFLNKRNIPVHVFDYTDSVGTIPGVNFGVAYSDKLDALFQEPPSYDGKIRFLKVALDADRPTIKLYEIEQSNLISTQPAPSPSPSPQMSGDKNGPAQGQGQHVPPVTTNVRLIKKLLRPGDTKAHSNESPAPGRVLIKPESET